MSEDTLGVGVTSEKSGGRFSIDFSEVAKMVLLPIVIPLALTTEACYWGIGKTAQLLKRFTLGD